ncbi:MAG: VWA domain-containing protein [Alistipes sp.]|nr:VWA domain-containing protein [Alistipes sp.]
MFRFANLSLLWLLAVVPVLVALLVVVRIMRRRSLVRFGNPALLKELMPEVAEWRVRLKTSLQITALVLLILAAARPQFGSKLREERARGVEMMLVVDVSNSMLAEDLAPNRLDRTRYAIDRLFASLSQERVGMVVFAGEAKVQLPITSDYRMARSFAKRLSPDLVAVQGTDLAEALSLATLSFSDREHTGRAMILITDGEAHDEGAVEAARRAAEQGIHIFVIGIGTPEGAPVRVGGEFIRDESGEMVVTKLNEKLLQEVAEAGKGGYIRATNAAFGLDEIVREIEKLEQGELSALRFEEYNEQFVWLVALALALLLLDTLILGRRNPALRRFNIFGE